MEGEGDGELVSGSALIIHRDEGKGIGEIGKGKTRRKKEFYFKNIKNI